MMRSIRSSALVLAIATIVILSSSAAIGGDGSRDVKGDMNCDGSVNPIDSLLILRYDAGLAVNLPADCDAIGGGGAAAAQSLVPGAVKGDVNCDQSVSPIDSLLLLRHDAGLTVDLPSGCQPIGESQAGPSEPTNERVPVLYDDLQNGRFDAFVPVPGGQGTFSVTDDGGGNMVAHLTGDVELRLHPYATEGPLWQDYETTVRVKRGPFGAASFGIRWNPANRAGYWLSNSGNEWKLSRQSGDEIATLQSTIVTTPVDAWFDMQILVRTVSEGALIEANLDSDPVAAFIDPDAIEIGALEFRLEGTDAELRLDELTISADVDSRHTWTQTGGPFGGWLTDVAVDPTDWKTAYVGGVDGGVFKTTDGGASWTEVGLPNGLWKVRVRSLALAPSDPSVIYAAVGPKGVGPLWRSDDGGATWRWTAASDITFGVEPSPGPGQHLDEPGDVDVFAIGIDPTDSMHIFVGVHDQGVWESTDGGSTLVELQSGGDVIRTIAIDPGDPDHILAATADPVASGMSVIRSTDGGANWNPSDAGLDGNFVQQLFFYPPDPTTILAVTGPPDPGLGRMLFRSTDGGATWSSLVDAAPGIAILHFSADGPGTILGFADGSVFGSTDQGDTWTPLDSQTHVGLPTAAAVGTDDPQVIYVASEDHGVAMSTDLGTTWQLAVNGLLMHPISALAVDPNDPGTIYTGGRNGLHTSTDYGDSWTQLTSLAPGARDLNAIAIDPRDSNTIYRAEGIELVQGEVFKSTDGGDTWQEITGSISYSIGTLVLDPGDPETIYAGTGGGPQAGPQGLGLYRSQDGGDNWVKLDEVPDVAVPAVVVDPLDSDHIVIGTMGHGVLVSSDGGETFEERNNGMGDTDVDRMIYSLAMNPEDPDIMYAGTHRHYGHVSGFNTLYKTTDGGESWVPSIQGDDEGEYPFILIAAGIDTIDLVPGQPDWVYVGLHDPGVIFSSNGGADWQWANHGLTPLLTHIYPYRMAMSTDGNILYSGGCGRSVFRNLIVSREDSSGTPLFR